MNGQQDTTADVSPDPMTLELAESMVEASPNAAAWFRQQRRDLRIGILPVEVRESLDLHYPGWDSVELDQAFGI